MSTVWRNVKAKIYIPERTYNIKSRESWQSIVLIVRSLRVFGVEFVLLILNGGRWTIEVNRMRLNVWQKNHCITTPWRRHVATTYILNCHDHRTGILGCDCFTAILTWNSSRGRKTTYFSIISLTRCRTTHSIISTETQEEIIYISIGTRCRHYINILNILYTCGGYAYTYLKTETNWTHSGWLTIIIYSIPETFTHR